MKLKYQFTIDGYSTMKSLYLNSPEPLYIFIDGSALCVHQESKSLRRYPLSRVSRLVISCQVYWNSKALSKCLDRGIGVNYLSSSGTLDTKATRKKYKTSKLSELWYDFHIDQQSMSHYKVWSRTHRHRAVKLCAWLLGWTPRAGIENIEYTIKNAALTETELSTVSEFNTRLVGLVNMKIYEVLNFKSIRLVDEAGFRLHADILHSIEWGLYPEMVNYIRKASKSISMSELNSHKSVVVFFENNESTIDFILRDFLIRLQHYLQSVY